MKGVRMFLVRWRGVLAAATAVAAVAAVAATAVAALSGSGPVTVGSRRPESPAVSGRYVVWSDRAGGSFDIMLCDTATGVSRAIASSPADEIQPAIFGERVVYVSYASGSADIHLYDIASGTTRVVCAAADDQVAPSVWGDTVVWEDYRSGYQPAIYGYDLAGGYEFLVESGYNRPKRRPQTAGSLIVWEDYTGQATGRPDADIRVLDRATGAHTTVAGTSVNEMVPATDGRWVVWAEATAEGMDIRAHDTSTGRTSTVRRQTGEQSQPAVGGGVAYWIDNTAGQMLHIDAYSLAAGRALAFDTRGVGEAAGVDAQGGSVVWLERNASRWQVRAHIGAGPLPTGLGMASPARVWNPLRLPLARFRDRVAPALASASVRDGAVSVRADSFTLTFTESLDADTARGGVTLTDAAGDAVAAEVTYSAGARTLTVRPRVRLVSGVYALKVSPGLRDRSGNAIGETPALTFSTGPAPLDTTPPSAPGKPFARVSGLNSVSVGWVAAVDYGSGVSTYTVWRAQTVTSTPTQVATVASSVTSATFAKVSTETLPAKYTYYYAVRAIDASGNAGALSAWSSPDPHGTYSSGFNILNCTNCHSPHGASPAGALGAKSASGCYYCHGNTVTTPQYGYGSTYDTQGGFGDDAQIATTGPQVGAGTRWVHRNAYMAAIGRECDACHTPHRSPATRTANGGYNLLLRTQLTTPSATYRYNSYTAVSATLGPVGNRVCFDCHGDGATDDANTKIAIVGGSTAYANAGGDHRTGWTPSLNLHADTSKVASTSSNPGIQCTACHDNHGGKVPRLLGTYDATAAVSKLGSRVLTGNNPTVCLACHSSALSAYSRNASGYPLTGRWPGEATYTVAYNPSTHMGSMHGTATANVVWPSSGLSTGDCKNCHVMHGAANPLDILRGGTTTTPNYSASTFAFCFVCHDGSPASTDIKSKYPAAAGGTSADPRSGHRTISTTGTLLPGGASVPCYSCHNPHGSTAAYGLLVVTQSGGATVVVGDSAGEIDMSSAAGIRRFCFACHTTALGNSGWNGSAMASVVAGDRALGFDRFSQAPVGSATGPHLRLPAVNGHYHYDTQSCLQCHADPHQPTGGLSTGGSPCYACHTAFKERMDAAGTQKTGFYHHVLGTSTVTYTGDQAPFTGAYPTSNQDLFCVSCHTDHNYFNGSSATSPAANLRVSITNASGAVATNTDFMSTGSNGICVSCHSTVRTKDLVNQKSDGRSTAPAIAGAPFAASAHNYNVNSTFGSSTFRANCSKCHTDEQTRTFQGGAFTFGTHYSTTESILAVLGSYTQTRPAEQACLKCHRAAGDVYGTAMTAAAKVVESSFTPLPGGSLHPLSKVTCASCHGVHRASASDPAADPDNTYNSAGYSLADTSSVNAFCIKCHDGSLPAQTINASVYIPYTVSANATANIGAYYASDGHGYAMPGTPYTTTTVIYATATSDTPSTWNNDANSTGAPDGTSATSNNPPFDMWQQFSFPAGISAINAATLTVRSQATGFGTIVTPLTTATAVPTMDVSVLPANCASTTPFWNDVDDPVGTPDTTTFFDLTADAGTNQILFSTNATPAIPSNATSISVRVVYRAQDVAAGTNWVDSLINVGGTTYTPSPQRWDPPTAWTTTLTVWAVNPKTGAAWQPAEINTPSGVNGLRAFGLTHTDGNPDIRVTQVYLGIQYMVQNDDNWSIQYSTDNGASWADVVGSSIATESSLTSKSVSLTGILTAANRAAFQVRVLGQVVGAADGAGAVAWDASTLSLAIDGAYPGPVRADCRDCHEKHSSTLPKLLRKTIDATSVPANDARVCFACHDANGPASNIARYYPPAAYGTAPAVNPRSGHRTKTAGNLPAGSALPCNVCHNPHGGAGGSMLLFQTQPSAGVTITLGDAAGEVMMTDADQATPVNVRRFCLSCHITSDATGQGWNGTAMANVTGGQVLGIPRTGGVLKLPAQIGHRAADTGWSCHVCHGDDFSGPRSVNVHNPASGESRGGIQCYACHTVYQDRMEDSLATTVGPNRTAGYHHVLGNAANDGDTVTYPLSSGLRTDVFCLSCHVDHNLFSPFVNASYKRGSNLRLTIGAAAPASTADATNTDFGTVANPGVCLYCHSVRLARDNTDQKSEATSSWVPTLSASAYAASAHNYSVTSTFAGDSSTFRANCAKCHDSEIDGGGMESGVKTGGYQTGANRFSVHDSAARRVLGAMGVAVPASGAVEEANCYMCHSRSSEPFKSIGNRDYYNATSMNASSQALYSLMSSTYAHGVGSYDGLHRPSSDDETRGYISANRHVECEDCHDPHAAQASRHAIGTNAVSGALQGVAGATFTPLPTSNWTTPTVYATVDPSTTEWQVCFKCHSGYNTNVLSWGGTAARGWTDVALEFNPGNGSYHPVVAALPAADPSTSYGSSQLRVAAQLRAGWTLNGWRSGGFTRGGTMYCSDCHVSGDTASFGPHGSGVKWMLHGPNQAWPYNNRASNGTSGTSGFATLAGSYTDGPDGIFCRNCHDLGQAGTVHTTTDKHGGASRGCVMCHVRVPHGSKVGRLQAVVGNNTWVPGQMPRRLTPDGIGTQDPAVYLDGRTTGYVKGTGAPAESSCSQTGCGTHSSTVMATSDARW